MLVVVIKKLGVRKVVNIIMFMVPDKNEKVLVDHSSMEDAKHTDGK